MAGKKRARGKIHGGGKGEGFVVTLGRGRWRRREIGSRREGEGGGVV